MIRRRPSLMLLICLSLIFSGIQPALWVLNPTAVAAAPDSNRAVTAIAFDPDGKTFASGYGNGEIVVWDIATREKLLIIGAHHGAAVSGLEYSSTGSMLASAGRDSVVQIWNLPDGTERFALHGHSQPATGLSFSPDDVTLASVSEDTQILIWNVTEGRLQSGLAGHKDFITSVEFSPDESLIASSSEDGTIKIWEAETGDPVEDLLGHDGSVESIDFNSDGTELVSGGEDTVVRVWDVETGEQTEALEGHGEPVTDVAFQPEGDDITSVSDDTTTIVWDATDGKSRRKTKEGSDAVTVVAYSDDGVQYAVGMHNGVVKVRDAQTGRVLGTFRHDAEPKSTGSQESETLSATADDTSRSLAQASPTQGPGGPILIVRSPSGQYGDFYAEILRSEGFNEFATTNIGDVTATTLAAFDVVILAQMTLSSAQVTTFTNWVNGGGNLIAMRPDKQLAPLLGLTDATSTVSEGYILVNTSTAPGAGIVNQTMQFHGTADRYTLNGATSVATLYSNSTTATVNPAVSMRSVGASGGQASAFTYDLARSVAWTRQGNTAWNAQERDGLGPIRSNDLFFGAAPGDVKPDWIDFTKVAIPQADEQMRLLSNLIIHLNIDKKPLPRFWYFPDNHKAVVVMTGDDHGNNGTQAQFDTYNAASPAGCSVEEWECVRATSYIYPNTPLSNTAAAGYQAQGFEIGLHLNTFCQNYSESSIQANFSGQLAEWRAKYTSLPSPQTNRTHCIAWSDWSTQANVSLQNGVRMDTNYYYWPPSWVQDRPGFFTGSGMPMRFVDLSGNLIDVYHVVTQITDESGQSQPFTINTLLDRALGPEGYYGAFTVNAHTDLDFSEVGSAVVASAQARDVPIVSSKQMLTWVDGRNNSSFSSLNWSGTSLSFTINQDPGARGLQAMLPRQTASGNLVELTLNGAPVEFDVSGVKGVEYAVFPGGSGNYVATYGADTTAPSVTSTSPASNATGVLVGSNVTATFSEAVDPASVTTTSFTLQNPAGNAISSTVTYDANTRVATLDPGGSLVVNTTYTATIRGGSGGVVDLAGNPLAANRVWTFTTEAGPNCPCTIFTPTSTPAIVTENDPNAVELGVKFRTDTDGVITGIRYYKGPQNTGTHTGSLWSSTGTLLARATFSGETASGWQQVNFSTPVAVTANTTYVASYHTTSGFYSLNGNYFSGGVTRGPLHAFQSSLSGGNGVYNYSGAPSFPNQSYQASNYWVDVVFALSGGPDVVPPTVTGNTPAANAIDVAVDSNVGATFSENINASTLTTSTFTLRAADGTLVPAAVTYDSNTRTATLNPNANLAGAVTYTATLTGGASGIKDGAGNALASNFTWSFTTVGTAPDTTPPTVTGTSPTAGATNVAASTNVTATFNEAMNQSTITNTTFTLRTTSGGTLVAATVTYNATTRIATLDPGAGLAGNTSYTATIVGGANGVKDTAGNALAANLSWSFTTVAGPDCPCTIWADTATPAVPAENDSAATELGLKFRTNTDGFITGVRFYKSTQNTGTHTGSLWSSTGQLLARVTFTGESASGWQQMSFSTPVEVTANTVYVVSYHAPVGRYAINENFFTSTAVIRGPLEALQNGVSGNNGVYIYSGTPAFPTEAWLASNYWVDVVFTTSIAGPGPDTTPPTVTGTNPAANAQNVAVNANVTATFSEAIDQATLTTTSFVLRTSGGTLVPGAVTYNATTRVATLNPTADLNPGAVYTATITGGASGVKDVAGNALANNLVWSFTTAAAGGTCASSANEIVIENCKEGTPASVWDVNGNGDSSIQGFATDMSVDQGETVRFKVNTNASAYRLDIYRIGYYDGDGARFITSITPSASLPQSQPNCLTQSSTGLVDCGNWAESASWATPADAVSGVYIARLVRADTNGASHIIFIVRDDDGNSDLLFQTADTTWQAYNNYGGNNLYSGNTNYPSGRAVKVSYNRPFSTRGNVIEDSFFNAEYPMIRWIERNGYDVSYFSGIDTDRFGAQLVNHKAFLSVGHDEYWSATQRAHVETARAAGVHLAFFSGNEVYWKTRWEASIDSSNTSFRTLVTYKEGSDGEVTCGTKCDPLTNVWTGLWRSGCEFTAADGCRPENALTGQISWHESNSGITVQEADGKMRFWSNTSMASLAAGQSASLPTGVLGYEWNYEQAAYASFNPPGRITFSNTTVSGRTHKLSLYRHSSGALVFGAGTVQWSWGLDATHDRSGPAADARMQQATINLLADMGVQPATIQSGVVAASASSDATAPTSTITSPASGATVAPGTQVTISGTATDTSGVVGLVEISVDGGTSWNVANGRGSWTYTWTTPSSGTVTIRTRATDDSGNIETPSAGIQVTVGTGGDPGTGECPCTIWADTATPAVASKNDTAAVEVGVKFRTNTNGYITGVRFYKGTQNTGTHTGSLWSSTGQLLARVTFTGESASGWQQMSFSTPVAVTANTVYVVSYHAPVGRYAINESFFTSAVIRGPLEALQNGVSGNNGVYIYSGTPAFPTQSWNASNYWVDVVFVTALP